ncbi:MAG: hypothetical protein AB7P03_03635 [Kofleriaceae bacterium]
MLRALALASLIAATGCAGSQRTSSGGDRFECRDRSAKYVAAHHMAGELGVQMDCAQGPRILRWRTDKSGARQDDSHSMTPGEFDKVWREIDGTGWTYLKDCTNGTMGKNDPMYTFEIKDDQNSSSFQCQSQSMPYPYNAIVDPLDLAAQQGRGQLGDDEPQEMKELDKKKATP